MATPDKEPPDAAAPPADDEAAAAKSPPSSSGGGIKPWLPLIVTIVAMPALAYATTVFMLLPKVRKAMTPPTAATTSATPAAAAAAPTTTAEPQAAAEKPAPPAPSKAKAKTAEKGKEAGEMDATLKNAGVKLASDGKINVPLNKILVNISGSMGSRYLLTSLTLASDKDGFGELILNNEAQLVDLASGVLSTKSIADLEKPDARSVIRLELETVFNNALGAGTVQDVYFTEFAVQ